jgi:hypothetical protein
LQCIKILLAAAMRIICILHLHAPRCTVQRTPPFSMLLQCTSNLTTEHGVFDALKKQYLDSIIFAIYDGSDGANPDANLLECYQFKIDYDAAGGDGVTVTRRKKSDGDSGHRVAAPTSKSV